MAKASGLGSGAGELAILKLKVIGNAGETSPLTISQCKLSGQYGQDISWTNTVTKTNGQFTVLDSTAATYWTMYK